MNILAQHFSITDNCLRACVYADFIGRQKVKRDSAWASIMQLCYAEAVLSWNQLFGQQSQETHWSHLVNEFTIPPEDKLKPFSKEMILRYLSISDEEWGRYHQSMVNVRNVRIAHLNVAHAIEVLPNITIAMHCCYLYREWLTEVLHFGNRQGFNIKISSDRASDAVKFFENQIREAYIGQ